MEIAIISGKGGTGKSSISAAFATLSEKVVLADCDVDATNLYILFNPDVEGEEIYIGSQKAVIDYSKCINCGLCIEYCKFDAIYYSDQKINISSIHCDGCKLCSRICPNKAITMIDNDKSRMYYGSFRNGKMVYGKLAPGEENSGKLVNIVRDKAKKLAKENNINTIIIDGPPGIGCPVISTITGVDYVIIVTEPTLSGLKDLQRTLELTTKFNLNTVVIINKFDLNIKITEKIENFCEKLDIKIIGKLAFDPQVVAAMINCKSIIEWQPASDLSSQIKHIYNNLIYGQ
ncbi:MAG: P-loop NTPase [Bacteroidales bacterium]|jgi:MinD superfamily P-loop ATPase|nr:P-loop NTPase [Bacteroidales bacterium]MDD3756331.1 P-loop NTPase [Bacteroidales bacterium]MDI9575575.1 P-loop NTPase [Bacteroidota bacterium]MDY0401141.1 P-loop NTPase [Bacteroidales bacterium]HHW59458.1 P-loop NTPase [Bacteroidales bacterium]